VKYSRANRPRQVAQIHQRFRHQNPGDRDGLVLTNVDVLKPPEAAVSPRRFCWILEPRMFETCKSPGSHSLGPRIEPGCSPSV